VCGNVAVIWERLYANMGLVTKPERKKHLGRTRRR
jgi:hypothetical protein